MLSVLLIERANSLDRLIAALGLKARRNVPQRGAHRHASPTATPIGTKSFNSVPSTPTTYPRENAIFSTI
jgi:hypothetical protein